MKKYLSIIASIISTLSVIPTAAVASVNTFDRIAANNTIYEIDHKATEYLAEDLSFSDDAEYYIYKSINESEEGGHGYIYGTIKNNKFICSTLNLSYNFYSGIKEEEIILLSEYIISKYPDVLIEKTEYNGIKLVYDDSITYEKIEEIAMNIKNDVGILCNYAPCEDVVFITGIGDLNADNTITASDAAMALSYYASGQTALTVASDEETVNYSLIADYNNDGMVTAVDAALILSDYAKGQVS